MSACCRACDEPILWAKTPDGRWIPMDPRPRLDPIHSYALLWPDVGKPVAVAVSKLYDCHVTTCKNREGIFNPDRVPDALRRWCPDCGIATENGTENGVCPTCDAPLTARA